MADNYLEKRYEETLGNGKTRVKRIGHTVDELLTKNRSTRGYKKAYKVSRQELERIAGVCTRIPSARNPRLLEDDFLKRRDIRRQIKHDQQWMATITTKLPILDLKLQDAVNLEATNLMEGQPLMRDMKTSRKEYKEMMIMKTIQQIKNDPTWYQTVVKDAEKKGISIEQNLRGHAEYSVNIMIKKGTITLPEN